MATGNELVLKLSEDDLVGLLTIEEFFELSDPAMVRPDERLEWLVVVANGHVEPQLRDVHERLVRERFDPKARRLDRLTGDQVGYGVVHARTPAGRREFSGFTIEGFGLEGDENGTLGISLWGRYTPVWCDWRHQHGGSGEDIVFDAELAEMVDAARAGIAAVVPAIADGALVVVDQFY